MIRLLDFLSFFYQKWVPASDPKPDTKKDRFGFRFWSIFQASWPVLAASWALQHSISATRARWRIKGTPPPLSGVRRNSPRPLFFNIFLISSWGTYLFRFWCPRPPKRRPRWPKRWPRSPKMFEKSTQIGTRIHYFWGQVLDPMLGPIFGRRITGNLKSESYKSNKND